MTTFWRNSYWRTSVNGVLHEVQGHVVDRREWERSGSQELNTGEYVDLLQKMRAGHSFTSTNVNPNANCPICGAQVFFYQNGSGSRVYFDELGPPWPKHSCTDSEEYRCAPDASAYPQLRPAPREKSDAFWAKCWTERASLDPEDQFAFKYKLRPWYLYVLEGRVNRRRRSFLLLSAIGDSKPPTLYIGATALPYAIKPGSLIYYYKNWISFFDEATSQPSEQNVERFSGASALLEQLFKVAGTARNTGTSQDNPPNS